MRRALGLSGLVFLSRNPSALVYGQANTGLVEQVNGRYRRYRYVRSYYGPYYRPYGYYRLLLSGFQLGVGLRGLSSMDYVGELRLAAALLEDTPHDLRHP